MALAFVFGFIPNKLMMMMMMTGYRLFVCLCMVVVRQLDDSKRYERVLTKLCAWNGFGMTEAELECVDSGDDPESCLLQSGIPYQYDIARNLTLCRVSQQVLNRF